MLTPVLRAVKVIYHAIKKVHNNYVVLSVRRFNFMNYYAIQVYVPRTRRQWVCFIYPSDFNQFESEYMERLFPAAFWQHRPVLETFETPREKSYAQFCQKYRQDVASP